MKTRIIALFVALFQLYGVFSYKYHDHDDNHFSYYTLDWYGKS